MAILDDRFNNLTRQCNTLSQNATDTEVAIAENYEKQLTTESAVTDLEVAITELYELMIGG